MQARDKAMYRFSMMSLETAAVVCATSSAQAAEEKLSVAKRVSAALDCYKPKLPELLV